MRQFAAQFIGLLLGLSLAGCVHRFSSAQVSTMQAQTPLPAVPANIPDLQPQHPLPNSYVLGIANFGIITRDIWRGSEPTPQALKTLAAMGAKTIIDLRQQREEGWSEESLCGKLGITYRALPTSRDHCDQVDTAELRKLIAKSPKPIFIHCHAGRDRTGFAVAVYRLDQWRGRVPEPQRTEWALAELRNFHVHSWWTWPMTRKIMHLASAESTKPPVEAQQRPATASTASNNGFSPQN